MDNDKKRKIRRKEHKNKFEPGDKVYYYFNKHDKYAAVFAAYYESAPDISDHMKNCIIETTSDEPNTEGPNYNGRTLISVWEDKLVPYYESQDVEVNYKDLYEVIDTALCKSHTGHYAVLALMANLGFEVPEDNQPNEGITNG